MEMRYWEEEKESGPYWPDGLLNSNFLTISYSIFGGSTASLS